MPWALKKASKYSIANLRSPAAAAATRREATCERSGSPSTAGPKSWRSAKGRIPSRRRARSACGRAPAASTSPRSWRDRVSTPIRPGDRVLVHMAAGGVGTAVLQLCRTVERVVTIGTASASKHDYVRSQGCDHVIDYRSVDYAAEVRRLTGGLGVDLVLDALGG